jgi:hypothetical protein
VKPFSVIVTADGRVIRNVKAELPDPHADIADALLATAEALQDDPKVWEARLLEVSVRVG